MPDLWTVLEWAVWAIYQYALLIVPVLRPDSVPGSVPKTWWYYNTYWDWYGHIDGDRRPDAHWLRRWFWMCLKCSEFAITSGFRGLITQAVDGVKALIGGVPSGFQNLGQWVEWLNKLTGGRVPYWIGNLSAGLDWLRDRLPAGIRGLWQTWDQIFESIRSSVRNWVRSTYDRLVALGTRAWDWASSQGEYIKRWLDGARGWLDRLRADPYGVITGYLGNTWRWLISFAAAPVGIVLSWLGPDWQAWLTFRAGPAAFLYNLWSAHHTEMSRLFSDPRGWLIDRLESALLDRW